MVDIVTIGVVVVGALTAATYYQQRKMQREAEKQANEMASHQISGHDSNRALYTVYGRALIGTTTIYKRVSRKQIPMANASFINYRGGGGQPDTSSKLWGLNRFLYRISALSNGPIDGIEKVLIDGESHLATRFTVGHSRHFEAAVSLGPTAGNYFSNLKTSYSTDFGQWDSSKKGQGVAYVVERFWFDKSNPAYQGEPRTQYLVRGRKLYDPRLDSTVAGGSGLHRSATPSTWAFSDNPALALLDMLTNTEYGRGVSYSECDLASFITAANKCDTLVDIPARATNSTGSTITIYDPHTGLTYDVINGSIIPNYRFDQETTGPNANKQKRFRLNMAVDNSKEVLDNIQQILQSFRANLHHINGEYAVHMDDVASPVITLGDDDIIGGLKISQGDRKQRINRMTAKFLNAYKHYKTDQVSWPPLDETSGSQYETYLTEDSGEKLHKTVTLTGCTDYYQAEDIAEYLVRESRATLTATGTFGSRCFNLVPGDVIALDYDSAGYSGKYFIVDQVGVDVASMNVKLSLREYDSSVYTWNANRNNEPIGLFFDEEQQYNATPTSPTIGTVSTDSVALSDGSAALRLNIPFSDIPEEALSVEIGWSVQNADVYTSQVILDETATKAEFLLGIDDQVIDLRIRYFVANADGVQLPSSYTTTTFTLPAISGTKLDNIEDNATRNQVFQQDAQPSGGAYQDGDIWIDTNDNFKMYMYDSGAWVLRADSRIATALADAASAASTADGKIDTFYQDDEPSSASLGDLWIDTNDGNKLYRHDGTNFQAARDAGIAEAIADAETAQSTADNKITTFFAASTATPTAEGTGDMWYQTDTAVMQRWNGSTWNNVASYNTGDLADLDTVGNSQIDNGSINIDKLDDLQSTNYSQGVAGWKLTKDGTFETGDGTFRGEVTATSGTIGGFSIGSTALTAGSGSSAVGIHTVKGIYLGATTFNSSPFRVNTAGQLTATNASITGAVTANDGSIGGINIDTTKLYAGTGDWANSNTGFYLDNAGKFSLKDKLFFDPSNNTLTVDGNITADVITAKQNLVVLGDLQASSVAAGSITRSMLSQDALDEIFGSLASSVGGSNGDFKEGTGTFTTSGGSVTLGTSSDKFDHGSADVEVEFNINTFFYTTTNYTQAQAQATLTFEATADGTFNDLNSADKTHTLQFFEYDLSSYYGYTYLVYHINTAVTKTFTSGSGSDLADNTDVQFRVAVSSVGSAFTGQTVPFSLTANEGVTGVTSTGGNADTLDNLDSTAFLRSNVDDTFDGNLTITGDLILQGGIDQYNVTNLTVDDKTITVNAGSTQALSDGAGLIIDRGTAADASITWNETSDKFYLTHPISASGADFTSTTAMDINLVANPPELNFEDTSSNSGTKRARWTLDSNTFSAQGLNDADSAVTHQLLQFNLSNGNASFGGALSSGIITATGNIKSSGVAHPEFELIPTGSVGNADIRFDGTSLDIRSNSSSAYLTLQTATTERLKITNTGDFEFNGGNFSEVGTIDSGNITTTGHLNINTDSGVAYFGADQDLRIYHDGSNARLRNITGDFRIQTTTGGVNAFVAKQNAEVELFYAGGVKLATTSTGVDVTGTISSGGITSSGAITAKGASGGFFYAEDTTTGATNDDLLGGFLFKNNDTSGTQPHYAGMTARAVNVYGSMALEFFADRADYENDTPALRLEPESGTDSTNSTLNFLNATKITGVNSISSGAITSSGNIQQNYGYELRGKDSGGTVRTLLRTNSDKLQIGWSYAGDVEFMGGGSYTKRMAISGSTGDVSIVNDLSVSGAITSGDITSSGSVNVAGDLNIASVLAHTGDLDTYFQFNAENTARIVVGGSQKFVVNSNGVSINNGTLTTTGDVDIDTGALKIGGTSIIGSNTRITAGDGTTVKAAYGFQSSSTTGLSYSSSQNRVNLLSGGAVVAYAQTPSTNPIAHAFYVDGSMGVNGQLDVTGTVEFDGLSGTGAVSVTDILDQDDMSSNSATALATQQSIKAYVDSQVVAVDTLAEVLANGNTTGGTDLSVSSGDDVKFADDSKALFGAGNDLKIYHSANNQSYIHEVGTGDLNILASNFKIQNGAGTENKIVANTDGAVTLFHNGTARLATTSTGVDVTGTLVSDGLTVDGAASVVGSITQGNGDLLYNGGGNWDIAHTIASQNIIFKTTPSGGSATQRVRVSHNGDVSLYEDTGTTAKLVWKSSDERLGIGTSLPEHSLHLYDAGSTSAGTMKIGGSAASLGLEIAYTQAGNTSASIFANPTYTNDGALLKIGVDGDRNANHLVLDGKGNVGIGTSTVHADLHLGAASPHIDIGPSSGNRGKVGFNSNNIYIGSSSGTGEIHFKNNIGSTDAPHSSGDTKMVITDSAVGIGSTSPAATLDVVRTGAGIQDTLQLRNAQTLAAGVGSSLGFGDSGGARLAYIAGAATGANNDNGYLSFYTRASDSLAEKMRIGSDGNVGIGRVPNSVVRLSVRGTDATASNYAFEATNSSYATKFIVRNDGQSQFFKSDNSASMTVTSDGNVLVGKTSSDFGTIGAEILPTGVIRSAVGGGSCILLNRKDSDGPIADFRRDNSTVGSAGCYSGSLFIGGGDVGIGFYQGADALVPFNPAANTRDAAIDLGTSYARFKDLYLSGTASIKGSVPRVTFTDTDGTNTIGDIRQLSDAIVIKSRNGSFNGVIKFNGDNGTTETEYARLDASGTLLVGKTNDTQANAGHVIFGSGAAYSSRDGFTWLHNRLSTDGDILLFQKDGSTVGSAGTFGTDLYIGTNDTGLRFEYAGINAIVPFDVNSLAISDAATDLGHANARFKNLYLSAAVRWYSSGVQKAYVQYDGTDVVHYGASGVGHQFWAHGNRSVDIGSRSLLVGTTTTDGGYDESDGGASAVFMGASIGGAANGSAFVSRRAAPLQLNRQANDGDIAVFRKDGTSVGSIGSNSSSYLYIGRGDTTLSFSSASDLIYPTGTAGAQRDGSVSLGNGANRFKDLYLSGYAYVGALKTGQSIESSSNLTFWVANLGEAARIVSGSGDFLVGKTSSSITTAGTTITSSSLAQSASDTSTNLGTNGGAVLNLCNTSATDGNFSNIGGYNSNGLVVSQINFINLSHSSRTGAITFSTHNGSALNEAMRIDDSRKIQAQTAGGYYLTEGSTDAFSITSNGANGYLAITDEYNSSERLRITQAGALLVGKSSSAFGTAGTELQADGAVTITRNGSTGGTPFFVNRLANDGELAAFYVNTAQIGSIGSTSGSMYIQGNPATGKVGLTFYGASIEPRDSGAAADAAVDLGATGTRFKDCYLSGSVSATGYKIGTTTVIDNGRKLTNITGGYFTGNVGINANNPDVELQINASNPKLRLLANSTTGTCRIQFADTGDNNIGVIAYSHSSDSLQFTTNNSERMRLDNLGNLVVTGNVTAYGTPSDIRLKENVERIANPTEKVKQLDGVTFNYKKDGSRSTGLIAQQLLEVLPEVVYEAEDLDTGDTHYAVRYGQVVGLLVEAVKELTQRIEELEDGNNEDN